MRETVQYTTMRVECRPRKPLSSHGNPPSRLQEGAEPFGLYRSRFSREAEYSFELISQTGKRIVQFRQRTSLSYTGLLADWR